jgi:hypothetical protein
MKKKSHAILAILLLINLMQVRAQQSNDTIVYLLTCGPGTETYSIYGHSALKVVIQGNGPGEVYNWGVFDFNTTHFAWKFAKGRLDYMLDSEQPDRFLNNYAFEKRYVLSQRINIDPGETKKLIVLITENLKPENLKYRYDFFYDDCTTRIRDLLEKSIGDKLLYPPESKANLPSFRSLVAKYQNPYPWLNFGIDLIMGVSADKKAPYRDRMFLPIEMKDELSETVINRSGKMIPLLRNAEVLLDFPAPAVKPNILLSPLIDFSLLLIITIIISSMKYSRRVYNMIDIIIFTIFSFLAVLMIFFNFFTDHAQMKMNLNIIWLNPLLIICLLFVLINRTGTFLFKLVFYVSVAFLFFQIILPQVFNRAIFPLVLILALRSSIRAGFEWNPLSFKEQGKP